PAATIVRAAYAPHSRPQSASVRAASAAAMTDVSGLGPCLSCSRTSARARLPTRCEAALVAAPGVLLLALALAGRAAGRSPSEKASGQTAMGVSSMGMPICCATGVQNVHVLRLGFDGKG